MIGVETDWQNIAITSFLVVNVLYNATLFWTPWAFLRRLPSTIVA